MLDQTGQEHRPAIIRGELVHEETACLEQAGLSSASFWVSSAQESHPRLNRVDFVEKVSFACDTATAEPAVMSFCCLSVWPVPPSFSYAAMGTVSLTDWTATTLANFLRF